MTGELPDPGASDTAVPTPEPDITDAVERYVLEDRGLTIDIVTVHCSDTMSGASFTHRVTVQVDGRTLRGCGLSLEPR